MVLIIVWLENATDIPTDADINAKATELENAYNSKQYQRDRKIAYKPYSRTIRYDVPR